MNLKLQQLPSSIRRSARLPFLAPDALQALLLVEKDTGGLLYTEAWKDPVASLLSRRMKNANQLPGYDGHNFGLSICVELSSYAGKYDTLLSIMKKRGWACHRKDIDSSMPEANRFHFFGEYPDRFFLKTTMDPATWSNAIELRIFERHGKEFQLSMEEVQEKLKTIGLYYGPLSGQADLYTREGILAFQRSWDMKQNGHADAVLARVLAFVTSDIELV